MRRIQTVIMIVSENMMMFMRGPEISVRRRYLVIMQIDKCVFFSISPFIYIFFLSIHFFKLCSGCIFDIRKSWTHFCLPLTKALKNILSQIFEFIVPIQFCPNIVFNPFSYIISVYLEIKMRRSDSFPPGNIFNETCKSSFKSSAAS